jgi:hypothetical protein
MKRFTTICVVSVLLAVSAGVSADPVDLGTLSSSPYMYDSRVGMTSDVTKISFDYSYGDFTLPVGQAAFRIRRLNDDDTDSWLGSFNIYDKSFNLDTDYGPYSKSGTSGILAGTNHFEFTLNRTNGLWDLELNHSGTLVDFVALAGTNATQPDGYVVTVGSVVTNKFFSDESMQSALNAVALGWATWNDPPTSLSGNAADGVGGTGAYRLEFTGLPGATGAFVENISVVPVPAAVLLGMLGLSVAGVKLRKLA